MTALITDFRRSLRQPAFWGYSTWLAILTDYRRMRLGLLWALVPPLLYCVGLGYMYSKFMGGGLTTITYIVHLGIGWSLWRMTTNVIHEASSVYTKHKSFILDGHVCFTDFILRVMSRALFNFAFAFAIVIIVMVMDPDIHWLNALTMIVTIPIYVYNLLWLGVAISLVGARFPDIRELISTILLFGFFLTPILWPASAMPAGSTRGMLARFNPAFHFMEFVWAPIIGGHVETTSYIVVGAMTVGGSLVAILMYRRLARFVPLWA